MTGVIKPFVFAAVLFSRADFDESLTAPQVCISLQSPFHAIASASTPTRADASLDELEPMLGRVIKQVQELPDGYAFQFPSDPETIAGVAEWAVAEKVCCPFFDIHIHIERERGPVWLTLTGREGTKEFIRVQRAAWLNRDRRTSRLE